MTTTQAEVLRQQVEAALGGGGRGGSHSSAVNAAPMKGDYMKKLSVLLVVVLIAFAAQSFAGVVLVAKTTAEGGRGVEQQNSVAKTWVSGDKGKTMFEESEGPLMSKGTYIIK